MDLNKIYIFPEIKVNIPISWPQNLIATLTYFDIFEYPLTFEEIQYYLLGEHRSEQELREALASDPTIEKKEDYYFLKGRKQIIETRKERQVIATKLWHKIHLFLPFIKLVPFIKMVAVCNTLAFNNPTKDSDIDLFIITSKNRLFLTRSLTTLLFSLLGIRRHGKKIAGRFCLSFYISEEAMNLEAISLQDDIYLLYWIKSLQVCSGEKTYQKFKKANHWIEKYFPFDTQVPSEDYSFGHYKIKQENLVDKKKSLKITKFLEWLLKGKLGNTIEKSLYHLQLKRHQKNLKKLGDHSSVIVNETMLKFHNIDRRREFQERFKNELQKRKVDINLNQL